MRTPWASMSRRVRATRADVGMITQGQLRAARVLLGWRQSDLAKRAGVAVGTVNRAETGEKMPRPFTMKILAEALTDAGIEFVDAEGEVGPGVRIKADLLALQSEGNDA